MRVCRVVCMVVSEEFMSLRSLDCCVEVAVSLVRFLSCSELVLVVRSVFGLDLGWGWGLFALVTRYTRSLLRGRSS